MVKHDEKKLAQEIYEQIGGTSNVHSLINCMTRVRVDIKDPSKVNDDKVKQINGVLGTVEEDTYQIILGPGLAAKVANEMGDIANLAVGEEDTPSEDQALFSKDTDNLDQLAAENKAAHKNKHNPQTPLKKVLRSIASIFIPLIPAFVGAGIIGGIASVFSNLLRAEVISGENWQYFVLVAGIIQQGLFGYLNIYVGINAAKVFKATEGLGGIIGGVVYLTGMIPEMPLPNIFTGEPLTPNQGGIIGVILAVWILSLLERQLRKVVPNSIDIIVTPTISLLVVGLATIFLIMPLAGFVSANLVGMINWILGVGGAFAGFVLGSLFLPMVMFGLHQVLTPIHVTMIEQTGSTQLLPILAMAGAGQVGAAFAILVRARKNKQLTTMIKGALPVGILGIGEPLIYAVTLPLGKPFITACIGGGIGGAVIGLFGGVGASAIGPSGVALIPLIVNNLWWAYVLGLLAAYAGGFVATYFFGIPKDAMEPSVVSL
ncbi:PTS transporter subunit EIIC [Marinilactibacillus sp. GCM10026970]|uniref:PTS transporter subunit EIIC n=1 Tax=Marinilactibacillus sp. GCM10026970 TaxID=3252642 RepID=UPI00360E84DE